MAEWQPIETAPKDIEILVCTEYGYYIANSIQIFDKDKNGNYQKISDGWLANMADLSMKINPTYWMPLPQPPKGE